MPFRLMCLNTWSLAGSTAGCLFFQDRISLYNCGCPGTRSVNNIGLKFTNIYWPLLPATGNKGMYHYCLAKWILFKKYFLTSNCMHVCLSVGLCLCFHVPVENRVIGVVNHSVCVLETEC